MRPTGRVPFGATCDARARGGAAELALLASLSPLKQRQRVRARSAHAALRARPTPCASRHGQKGGEVHTGNLCARPSNWRRRCFARRGVSASLWEKVGVKATPVIKSTVVAPIPAFPQRGKEPYRGRAQRWPEQRFNPLWVRRGAQRVGCANAAQDAFASCTDSLPLFERRERSERSEFGSGTLPASTAGCPQRSGGTQPVGPPFLWLLSFG